MLRRVLLPALVAGTVAAGVLGSERNAAAQEVVVDVAPPGYGYTWGPGYWGYRAGYGRYWYAGRWERPRYGWGHHGGWGHGGWGHGGWEHGGHGGWGHGGHGGSGHGHRR